MSEAAQLLEARGVDSIDINMGCPVNRIVKGSRGQYDVPSRQYGLIGAGGC